MKNIYTGASLCSNVLGLRCTAWLALIILFFSIQSCVTQKRCAEKFPPVASIIRDSTVVITEHVYDTTITLKPDAGTITALIECDSQNNALIKEITKANGERVKLNMRVTKNDKALHAIFDCQVDSMGIYLAFKTHDTTTKVNSVETKLKIQEVEKQLSWWDGTKVKFGGYAIGTIAALVTSLFLYIAWKVFTVATPQGAAISAGGGLLKWGMKLLRGGAILFALVSLCSFTHVRFKPGQWVYWEEVNQAGQKIVVIGKVLSKDIGKGTYRIVTNEGWKMHLRKEQLNLVPDK